MPFNPSHLLYDNLSHLLYDKLPSTCKAACFSKDLHAFTPGARILP